MALDQLDTPVRLTWDFPDGATGQGGVHLPAIAEAIVDGGVFYVTLQGKPLLHPDLGEVLKILSCGCQLLLTCYGSPDEFSSLKNLSPAGEHILLNLSAFTHGQQGVDEVRLLESVQQLRALDYEPILALTPLRENLCNIPDLMRFCTEHKITRFKLPNAHIGDSFHDYSAEDLPRWLDLDNFRKVWQEFTSKGDALPNLEIHDLFLWEIMTPDLQQNRAEYGGCQAGNSLSHVDCHGFVHPCAAWPQKLGKLPNQSLEDIWSGSQRLAVRERITRTPDGCLNCNDFDSCFGGCRGLAYHLSWSEDERDPMCSGPR